MFVTALIGQKGGTGKTTASLGLAVAAARAGQATAIIDLDPQANAANWKDRREAPNPAVVSAQVSRLGQTLKAAREHGAEFVVIDTPGKSDSAAVEAARSADLVLVPVRPQIFDLETLPAMRDLLRVAGTAPAYLVLNGLHPQARKQADEAKAMIRDSCGLAVCPVHLCQRASYAEAPMSGLAPQELDPDGKAAAELERLYRFVLQQFTRSTAS
ncbi:MAG: AAA family ATPase [Candidatus Competibacter sp.]